MEPSGEHWCDNWHEVAFSGATAINPKKQYCRDGMGGSKAGSKAVSKLSSKVVSQL
jgi:hypothetical protein